MLPNNARRLVALRSPVAANRQPSRGTNRDRKIPVVGSEIFGFDICMGLARPVSEEGIV